MKINILDSSVYNHISAGEVVEKPASIVKELVENSIDASASNIKIDLTDCGMKMIQVLDDGEGINATQLPIALRRHATSKIKNEDDLFKIATLGFRGEALPSIASVSELLIKSNDGLTQGYIKVINGEIKESGLSNIPKGTSIEVTKLFQNTPARFRNLGTTYQELSAISDYLTKVALANPAISFTLNNNKKTLIETSGSGDLLATINELYGSNIAKCMVPFEAKSNIYKINGYTTNNEIFRSNRSSLTILVNGRVIKNLNIQYAITDAYQTILPVGKYPVAVLNITCPFDVVDVNVHPTKLEIRFTDEIELRKMITASIKDALTKSEMLKWEKQDITSYSASTVNYPSNFDSDALGMVNEVKEDDVTSYTSKQDNDWISLFDEENQEIAEPDEVITPTKETIQQVSLDDEAKHHFSNLHYIGQYHQTYLLLEDQDTLYLIDQHAAMERCKYEEISKSFMEQKSPTYDLLIPITLDFNIPTIKQLIKLKDDFLKLGINFDEFGDSTIIVRSVPIWMTTGDEKEYLLTICDYLLNAKGINKAMLLDDLAKQLSCKKSIKAYMAITLDEVNALLKKMDQCLMPYTCPHGRPTIIKFSKTEIEKLFKRINQ